MKLKICAPFHNFVQHNLIQAPPHFMKLGFAAFPKMQAIFFAGQCRSCRGRLFCGTHCDNLHNLATLEMHRQRWIKLSQNSNLRIIDSEKIDWLSLQLSCHVPSFVFWDFIRRSNTNHMELHCIDFSTLLHIPGKIIPIIYLKSWHSSPSLRTPLQGCVLLSWAAK